MTDIRDFPDLEQFLVRKRKRERNHIIWTAVVAIALSVIVYHIAN